MCLNRLMLRFFICMETLGKRAVAILRSKQASAKLPDSVLDELARCFASDIVTFYEAPESRAMYEAWKAAQSKQTAQEVTRKP